MGVVQSPNVNRESWARFRGGKEDFPLRRRYFNILSGRMSKNERCSALLQNTRTVLQAEEAALQRSWGRKEHGVNRGWGWQRGASGGQAEADRGASGGEEGWSREAGLRPAGRGQGRTLVLHRGHLRGQVRTPRAAGSGDADAKSLEVKPTGLTIALQWWKRKREVSEMSFSLG